MDTFFAPAERVSPQELAAEIHLISQNAVMSGLLNSVNGVLAILNDHRQVVAVNDSFMKMLGLDDPRECLGLRPGEILQCIHAHEKPAGCGTTKFCSSCGAAISIVSSLGEDKPEERTCALTVNRGDKLVDMSLLVRSNPIRINGDKFLLLFIQDITRQQQLSALERTFYHDINNMLGMLLGASDLLVKQNPSELAESIRKVALRLHKEVAIQRCLSKDGSCDYQPLRFKIAAAEVLEELQSFFANHPAARNKHLEFAETHADLSVNTDVILLSRVLSNMIINALEATPVNGTVKVWLEHPGDTLSFCVWNAQEIPSEIANRIFQRNFSTKEESGRGIGTFSMKFFGETILGGQVGFTTSKEEGTIFRFSLPL